MMLGALAWCALFAAVRGDPRPLASVGCFAPPDPDPVRERPAASAAECVRVCEELSYGYALFGAGCRCANSPGTLPADPGMCETGSAFRAYSTGATVPGPPPFGAVFDVGETSIGLRWAEPDARGVVDGYSVTAETVKSPSDEPPRTLEWRFSNNTFRATLSGLRPGTVYALTVRATSPAGAGAGARVDVETEIGVPEPAPEPPKVIERHGDRIVVRISPAKNRNGPVSRYRVVVVDEENQRGFVPDLLMPFAEAREAGLPYYIAAELDPSRIRYDFTVGDGGTYDNYFNAPVPRSRSVRVSVGIVSEGRGGPKARYALAADASVLKVNDDGSAPPAVTALGAAVAAGAVLLVAAVGAAVALSRRVRKARSSARRSIPLDERRLDSDNSGFVSDDGEPPDWRSAFRERLGIVPRNFLEVDSTRCVGLGTYGRWSRGRVRSRDSSSPVPCSVQEIREDPGRDDASMLRDLDATARFDHDNALRAVGVCELPEIVYVVFEDATSSLKDLLLSSRRRDAAIGVEFSSVDARKGLRMAADVARGMRHLSERNVAHGRLCCRNVAVADGAIPKISGFGLSVSRPEGETPDYVRWTAPEAMARGGGGPSADLWSYGCLLWELLALGATPYPTVAADKVAVRAAKGMRPGPIPYVGDDLYQLCLNCWEVDPEERPSFGRIARRLDELVDGDVSSSISFVRFDGFEFEPYRRELEFF